MAVTTKTTTTQKKCWENCTCTAKSIIYELKNFNNQRFYKNAVIKQSVGELVNIHGPTEYIEHMY